MANLISSIIDSDTLLQGPCLASLSPGKTTAAKSCAASTTKKNTSFNLETLQGLKVLER